MIVARGPGCQSNGPVAAPRRASHSIYRPGARIPVPRRTAPRPDAGVRRDGRAAHDEVNRLLPPQPRVDARQAAFLFERRAHRRRRPPRPLGVAARPPPRPRRRWPRAARAARPRRAPAAPATASRATSRWLSRNAFQSMPACRGSMFCSISRRAKSSSRRSISRSTSDAGTSNGTRAASCFISSARMLALGRVPRLVLEVLAHPRAQRVERLELAEVLRELVVELRQHAALDRVDRRPCSRPTCRRAP